MSGPNSLKHKPWIMVGAGVLLVAALAWGFRRSNGNDADQDLPEALTVASLRAGVGDPGSMRGTMRDAMTRDDLTDDQRRQAARNMRTVWRETMQQRMDAYHSASAEEKEAILDEQIDEFLERQKEWQKRRAEEGESDTNFRSLFGSPTRQQRKERSESRNPDEMAKRMEYFSAMRARMGERGIDMPRWGNRGGGRGSSGPGPGPRRRDGR